MDKTRQAVNVFNKHAYAYAEKFMNVDLYETTLNLFCKNIDEKHASILDIACGPGNITADLLKRNPGYKITGIDLSFNMIEIAKMHNSSAEFLLMDARNISQLQQQFDAIICAFGLPYLSKPEGAKLIEDSAELLLPGGIMYLSTMEGEDNQSGYKKSSAGDEIYMNYHQHDYLTNCLLKSSFAIIDMQRIIYNYNNEETTDLVLLARKNKS